MKKKFLKTLVIILVVIPLTWIGLIFPAQSVEARTGQSSGLAPLNLQSMGMSLFTPGGPTAVQTGLIRTLKVQTIPPTAGIHFKLGEQSFVSGQDGIVTLALNNGENYNLAVDPSSANTDQTQFVFNIWSDGVKTDQRVISITNNQEMQVGFNVSDKVGMNFKDSSGRPVDPTRVTSITMQNALGDIYSFPDGQPRWFLASVVNRQADGLETNNIQYSVTSVLVDGLNVVDQPSQVFFATPGNLWSLSLQLYSVHITARDALFQNPIGSGVALEYPNGLLETIPFSGNKDVTINSLAQGNYHVQVTGVSGLASYTPINLSQDQEVDLMLPTQLDIFTAFAAGILFALGILFLGRRWLLRLRSRRSSDGLDRNSEDFQMSQYTFN